MGRVRCFLLGLVAGFVGLSTALAKDRTPRVHALVGGRVVVEPGRVLEKATIVLRDGLIEAVGPKIEPPPDARVWDLRGRTVYAGFIESYLEHTPAAGESALANRTGAVHENARVHPDRRVAESLQLDPSEVDALRASGFTVAHVVGSSGIFRGRSAVVSLGDARPAEQVLRLRMAHVLAFERDRWDEPGRQRPPQYPSSLMGCMALMRQTLLDAGWAQECQRVYDATKATLEKPRTNESLLALAPVLPTSGGAPVWIRTQDALESLRAVSLAREFDLATVLVGNGEEYRQLEGLRDAGFPLVLPLAFPKPPRFEDEDEALDVELRALRHWETAPENPLRVHDAGLTFAWTSHGLLEGNAAKKWSDPHQLGRTMRTRLRSAVGHGLPEDVVVAALTTVPARLLGLHRELGKIEKGKSGHLTVTDGDLLDETTRVVQVWVEGEHFEVAPPQTAKLDKLQGTWNLVATSGDVTKEATLHVQGSEWTLAVDLKEGGDARVLDDVRWRGGELLLQTGPELLRVRRTGKQVLGDWIDAEGRVFAIRTGQVETGSEDPDATAPPHQEPDVVAWPPRPEPAPEAVLVRGATIWTSGERGTLQNADLLVVGGRVQAVGRGLVAPSSAQVIEAEGKHVTPGLVDCHSHSNILGGVNEATHDCTAEVRIADVLNSESIALYRELAGGLTVANQLHGSANPIGGQNAVIKLRWGAPPQDLLLVDAPPGIKFALGENPKQSNWGKFRNDRYPQTRMGVEQAIRDRFLEARDYERGWDAYRNRKNKKGVLPPRRDLRLEALVEVLRGERLVHCHSYRQDEILMMLRLAEEFGFRIATFQHVLEGYKVADELAAHGAGASTFSDWWAYKFEVYDAIPYNGTLMAERGVVVSFNSDSRDLARRLHLEAAKAVKYGGLPEEDALRFVTQNPARQLGIEDRVGSLEPGKDGDFVVWSGHPFRATTICEQTWIEGRRYFDRVADLAARSAMEEERTARLERARRENKKSAGAEVEPDTSPGRFGP